MGYRTIVAGTDGSETAGRAVDKAARLAKITGARLILVSAVPAEAPSTEEAEELLRQAQQSVRKRGVKPRSGTRRGARARCCRRLRPPSRPT